ncbi:squalene synthase HpnC [Pirellulaceae bacterium SH449]
MSSKPTPKSWNRQGEACVITDLKEFGPELNRAVGLDEARQYCRELTRKHYENFSVASRLVPSGFRQHLSNIYSFCRWADDLSDEIDSRSESLELLQWWRESLGRCYEGECKHPVFVALSDTIRQFQIPSEPFEKLIDAFCLDQQKSRYESDAEILEYCSGSADPVGRILLYMVGEHHDKTVGYSDSICSGLQIANFCQDVRRDVQRDRIYLPREYWRRHKLDEASILSGDHLPQLQNALAEWGTKARCMLVNGLPLVRLVPRWLARDLQLFVRGGLCILDELARNNYDSWNCSIEVTKFAKLRLVAQAWWSPRSLVP